MKLSHISILSLVSVLSITLPLPSFAMEGEVATGDEAGDNDLTRTLPTEIMVNIFSNLTGKDLLNAQKVNSRFYEIICNTPGLLPKLKKEKVKKLCSVDLKKRVRGAVAVRNLALKLAATFPILPSKIQEETIAKLKSFFYLAQKGIKPPWDKDQTSYEEYATRFFKTYKEMPQEIKDKVAYEYKSLEIQYPKLAEEYK